MDASHQVLQSTRRFFFGTFLSRCTGFFRDVAIAIGFGSSVEIATFLVAYRLANVFRRLIAEGNLSSAVIPHLSALEEKKPFFFRDVFFSLGIAITFFLLGLEAALYLLKQYLDPTWQQTIHLMMWMSPSLLFLFFYSLNTAFLQERKKYFLSAFAPAACNLLWILCALIDPNTYSLAIAVLIGFMLQWLLTSSTIFQLLSFKEWVSFSFFPKEVKALIRPLFLGILGISAVQINSALDAIFSKIADPKGPAFLWYAIRLEQLPLALFGIGMASALLPLLSKLPTPEEKKALLQKTLVKGSTLMLLASFSLVLFAKEGIHLIFGHGEFTLLDEMQTRSCLLGYTLGLLPAYFVLILATGCYARKEYRLPMIGSLLSVVCNIFLNMFFVFVLNLGAFSIALATSLSAWINAFFLFKEGLDVSFFRHLFKTFIACTLASILLFALRAIFPEGEGFILENMLFFLFAICFLMGFILFCRLLKIDDVLLNWLGLKKSEEKKVLL